ncbi:MAG: flagellar biosynthesis repressor FlbT [Henriciella sp.]|nr:flagellar biosynthesis repressor FlbT [Henriciella sp.]
MPLKLSLKPGEAVIINGAVLRNGERRGTVLLENQARVLREKDVLRPEQVQSGSQRAYFAIMQLYLTGKASGSIYDQAVAALSDAMCEAKTPSERERIISISRACVAGEIYQALSSCRKLMKLQAQDEDRHHG